MNRFFLFLFLLFAFHIQGQAQQKLTLVLPSKSPERVSFGAEKLQQKLRSAGYQVTLVRKDQLKADPSQIRIGIAGDVLVQSITEKSGKEGFVLHKEKGQPWFIKGSDASGALYGCLELASRLQPKLPETLHLTDQPEMVLRGTCIGIQKPYYLPGRTVYEYPYTPETFPWFYDKELWIQYLDMMVENRYNSLYLWNGHPFASLVKLKEYPYAVEVDDATFKKNEEMFRFLTQEADKRGIWVIQMFYNILLSKPFAEKHNLKTQDRERPIMPLMSDYTRKSIAAFVAKYPNVGLLITLGEAMEGVGQDDVDWFTKTIIPGVQDGLKTIGQKTEPPIVLRAHDTDAPRVMKSALPLYKNLYTMAKFNGEALTTYTPRGKWAELHRTLSNIGTVHIENVHILANLEPFRYGSADFVQKSVQAMHNVYGANGLHLYPQASYWDWPYAADATPKRLLQVDRDWIWYQTWARYAWKANRDRAGEVTYWGNELARKYGLPLEKGKAVLEAYEQTGEISPKLLRRYGITDGNRQTLTLGMLMTQLINPWRYGLFTLLYESEAPEGEMIIEYAEKEAKQEKHIGETPIWVAEEVVEHGRNAVRAIDEATPAVTKDQEEFKRLRNDVYAQNAMAQFYADKARAAVAVLRYKYSGKVEDLEKALPLLKSSVAHYAELTKLTKDTYLYANSMQTAQRKIPMRGVNATYKNWYEMLPVFEKELQTFERKIDSLKAHTGVAAQQRMAFKPATVQLTNASYFPVQAGESIYADTLAKIVALTPELKDLKGLKMSKKQQQSERTTLTFRADKPVKLLVGFYNEKNPAYLRAPELETDASANDYGQAEIKISNAIQIEGFPPVHVHAFTFAPGNHTLHLGRGQCVLLGFAEGAQEIPVFDGGLAGNQKNIDWLFE
ncbi:alpha-d-galacturonidase [Siphonobacter sp.]|uniref:alpha-d-galacturonidase n=1 Tax=Siphonobacter sp. TaxID=1869184 RepID=UPI003B3A1399